MPFRAAPAPPFLLDTRRSRNARLRPAPHGAFQLADPIWAPRRERNRRVTVPEQYALLESTGRIDNFRRAAGRLDGPFRGRYYNDSDVYKWVEAAAFVLADGPDEALSTRLDTVIDAICRAQHADGYLNSYFSLERAGERWSNLRDFHELYCAGHLVQAAVAVQRCLGDDRLLRAARRFFELIYAEFGPHGRDGACGHQGLEPALVELFRETGDERCLQLSRRMIEARGKNPPVLGGSPYHQDHAPFRTLRDVTGHAVRMMYYCAGAADICLETDEPEYLAALDRLWASMTQRRMYVTGGIGSRYEGEAFGEDYELPNARAYAETCAAIGAVMWGARMLALTGHSRYAAHIEWTLYNAVLPGLSLSGDRYFYQNPLADGGGHRRQPWFDCACCPPNLARLLAQLPSYFTSCSDEGVWFHLITAGRLELEHPFRLVARIETGLPWDGKVLVTVEECSSERPFGLHFRLPEWAARAEMSVARHNLSIDPATGYRSVTGSWRAGDTVSMQISMAPRWVRAHPAIPGNRGRAALIRGPLLYCVEQQDAGGHDPRHLVVPKWVTVEPAPAPEGLDGVVALSLQAVPRDYSLWEGLLYTRDYSPRTRRGAPVPVRAVPYFAWANREPGAMAVWMEREGLP